MPRHCLTRSHEPRDKSTNIFKLRYVVLGPEPRSFLCSAFVVPLLFPFRSFSQPFRWPLAFLCLLPRLFGPMDGMPVRICLYCIFNHLTPDSFTCSSLSYTYFNLWYAARCCHFQHLLTTMALGIMMMLINEHDEENEDLGGGWHKQSISQWCCAT